METIAPLCASVRERLRSCVTVPSVAQCVEELVLNAVDASATCVAVRLHLPAGRVTLVDNGTGISRENMDMVGQRYATSKCHTTADLSELCHYGYRGEALASIRDTCLLMEISSRHCQSTQTYTRIFKKGEALPVTESSLPRPSKGTTITVHDVFHALPVRKKHMNEALELERIRSRLEAVGLIHPLLSISLRDDVTGNKLIQTHKSNGISGAFSHLFGNHKARPLKEVKADSSCFKVEGFVSMESHHNKNLQFVFINKRLVLKTRIHKLVNDLVGPSTICRRKGRNLKSSPELSKDGTMNVTSSPQKYSDRHGVYVLNISCPYDKYDITFEPTKTLVEFRDWQELLTCVEDLVRTMLVREGIVIKVETSTESSTNTVDAADSQEEEDEQSKQPEDSTTSKDYTKDLNTVNMTNCIHSAAVRRPRTTEEPQSVDNCTPQQDSLKLTEHTQNEHEDNMLLVSEAPGEMLTLAADLALSSSPSDKSVTPAILTSPTSGNSEVFQAQTRTHTMSSSENESDENVNVDEQRESPTLSQMLEPNTNTIESKVESCSIRQRDHTFISLSSQVSLSMEEFRKAFRRVPVSEDPKIGAPTCSLEGPSNPCKEKGLTPWERIRAEIVKRKLSESEDEEVIVSDSTCRSSKPKLSRINLRKNRISSESVGRQNDTDLRKSFQRSSSEAKANSITCKQQKTQQDRIVQDFNKIKERISEHSSQEMDSQRMEIPDEVKYDEFCQPAVIKDTHLVEMQKDKLTKDINELSCSNSQDAVNGSCMFIKDNSSNTQPEDTNMEDLHFQSNPTSDTLANGTVHGLESSKLHVSHCIAENPTLSAKLSRICKRSSSHLDQQTDVKMKYPTRDFLTTETLVNFINFEDVNDENTSSDTQKPEQDNDGCSKNKQSDKSAAVKSSIFDCDTEDEVREYFASKIEAIQKKCALKQVHFGETESVTIHNIQDVPSTPEPTTSKIIDVDLHHEVLPPELSKPKEAEYEYIPMPFAEYASKVLSPCKPCQAASVVEKDCESRTNDDQYTFDAAQILFKFPQHIRVEPPHTNTYRNNHLDTETLDESGIHLSDVSNPNTSSKQASAGLPDMKTQATKVDGNCSIATVQSTAKTNISQRELPCSPVIPPQSFSPQWARYPKALHSSPSSNMHSCSQSQGFPVESQGFSTDVQLTQPFRPTTLEGQEFEDSGLEADQEMTAGEEMDLLTLKASDGNSVMHHSDVPELSSKPTVESMAAASSKSADHQIVHCPSTTADEAQNVTLSPPTQETCRKDIQVLNSKSKDVQISETTANDSMAADVDKDNTGQGANWNESAATSGSSERAEGTDSGPQEQTESIIGQQWLCTVDKSGRKLYLHMATGNSTYEEPIVKSDNSTTAQTVPRTHPLRGVAGSILEQFRQQMADSAPSKVSTLEPESSGRMTTLLEEHQGGLAAEGGSKWRTQPQQDGGEQDSTSVTQLFDQWENPVSTSLLQNVLTLGSGPSTSRVVPYTLTKQMLPSIKVLGQMDRKFIMCLMNPDPAKNGTGELLVVIDQHAAHERVRLENLIDEAHEDDPDHPHTLKHTKMVPPIEMTLTQTEVRVMEAYRGQLQRKGLQFSLASGSRDEVRLLTLPTSLIQREADEAQRGRTPIALQVIETFLKEQVDTLQTSRGGSSVLPQTIMRCLAAEACHGAIKFGDRLTLSQCQELIASLSDCDLPFQCAHGRPAIMPLIDLGRLKQHYPSTTKARPRLWRLVQKMNEHGSDDVDS